MEIKILKETNNPVFHRKEVQFEIRHAGTATPDRYSIRQALASKMKAELGTVYVLDAITSTGTQDTIGRADVYQDEKEAAKVLPKHLVIRNLPAEERAKRKSEEKEKKPEAPAPAGPKQTEKQPAKPKEEKSEKPAEEPAKKEKPSTKEKD